MKSPLITITRFTRGAKRCPKCKKFGEYAKYPDGTTRYIHEKRFESFYYVVTEMCSIPTKERETDDSKHNE